MLFAAEGKIGQVIISLLLVRCCEKERKLFEVIESSESVDKNNI